MNALSSAFVRTVAETGRYCDVRHRTGATCL